MFYRQSTFCAYEVVIIDLDFKCNKCSCQYCSFDNCKVAEMVIGGTESAALMKHIDENICTFVCVLLLHHFLLTFN